MKQLLTLLVVVVSTLAFGAAAQEERELVERDYVFVFITTGPVTDLSDEDRNKAFAGHFGNMKRLAEEGKLLIAGPLGRPLSDPDHRGLFVFDETEIEVGQKLAETDPTVEMGVFVMTSHTLTTDAPLLDLVELDKEAAEKLGENAQPGANARSYMLATAPFDESLLETAKGNEGVLIAAKLHGSGPEQSDEVLLWLNAENAEAAEEFLPEDGEWTLHGWFGSKSVASIRVDRND